MTKRCFDILFALALLLVTSPVLFCAFLLASYDTKSIGVFTQIRIGQYGEKFTIFKLKTITNSEENIQNISKIGAFLRKYKLDELPQIFNILKGEMSVVGPRPDIPGYYDSLTGNNKKILDLKPGLTSTASIKYKNEEELLNKQQNPLQYNDHVIFPDKVKLNLEYLNNHTLLGDVKIILETIKTYLK